MPRREAGAAASRQTYSDTAIQTCLTMKVLFGMALRQTTGFVESLLRLVGLDWSVPDFSTLSRRQKTLAVNIPYHGSRGPLRLLIDSTGINVEGEDNSRPPLLPPVLRRKALRFQTRIYTMPFLGGQPLPRGLFSRPGDNILCRRGPRSVTPQNGGSPAGGFRSRVSAPIQKEPIRRGMG